MAKKKLKVDDKVLVYDRYRFAVPLKATVKDFATMNDGVEVQLCQSNNAKYPVGSKVWVHEAQLRRDDVKR